jgi:radical SAM protein with 4Fe4S-binding SPASM domain
VDTAGAIVPCTHSGVCFGTIDRGLSEALRPGGAYERYVSENIAGGVPACEGCEIEGACAGGCCVAREHRDGLEATVCAIYRESTRRLLPILLERSL